MFVRDHMAHKTHKISYLSLDGRSLLVLDLEMRSREEGVSQDSDHRCSAGGDVQDQEG